MNKNENDIELFLYTGDGPLANNLFTSEMVKDSVATANLDRKEATRALYKPVFLRRYTLKKILEKLIDEDP